MEYYPQFHRKNISPEWRDITEEFPEIFLDPSREVLDTWKRYRDKGHELSMKEEDLCNLRYGFECHIGWKEPLWKFCEGVRALSIRAREHGHDAFYKSFIIKEKFGTLREQGDWQGKNSRLYRDEYQDLSEILTTSSTTICEICGKPAECKNRKGWLFTRCDSCELKDLKV